MIQSTSKQSKKNSTIKKSAKREFSIENLFPIKSENEMIFFIPQWNWTLSSFWNKQTRGLRRNFLCCFARIFFASSASLLRKTPTRDVFVEIFGNKYRKINMRRWEFSSIRIGTRWGEKSFDGAPLNRIEQAATVTARRRRRVQHRRRRRAINTWIQLLIAFKARSNRLPLIRWYCVEHGRGGK